MSRGGGTKPTRKQTAVRLDPSTLARLEALRLLLSTEWRDATVSDILRAAIGLGLNEWEQKYGARTRRRVARPR